MKVDINENNLRDHITNNPHVFKNLPGMVKGGVTEDYIIDTFGEIKPATQNNPGYDWERRETNEKVELKTTWSIEQGGQMRVAGFSGKINFKKYEGQFKNGKVKNWYEPINCTFDYLFIHDGAHNKNFIIRADKLDLFNWHVSGKHIELRWSGTYNDKHSRVNTELMKLCEVTERDYKDYYTEWLDCSTVVDSYGNELYERDQFWRCWDIETGEQIFDEEEAA
jgi:hypothetical protein